MKKLFSNVKEFGSIEYEKKNNDKLKFHGPFLPYPVYHYICKRLEISDDNIIEWFEFYSDQNQFKFFFKEWFNFWSEIWFNARMYMFLFALCNFFVKHKHKQTHKKNVGLFCN